MVATYFFDNNMYRFHYDFENPDYIRIENDNSGKTTMLKVYENGNYVLKGNKKSISGIGGANGVFNFLADCIKYNFMIGYVNKVIHDYVK